MKYRVHYMRPDSFRRFIMGDEVPTVAGLSRTHAFLREIEATSMGAVYSAMQGERWSPNGEARPLIEAKGLSHTSMSVGDVIETSDGEYFVVSRIGFTEFN